MDCSPPRLLSPWDFPGKNTGKGCHFLLQGIFPTQGSNPHLLQSLHWRAESLLLSGLGSPGGEIQWPICLEERWAQAFNQRSSVFWSPGSLCPYTSLVIYSLFAHYLAHEVGLGSNRGFSPKINVYLSLWASNLLPSVGSTFIQWSSGDRKERLRENIERWFKTYNFNSQKFDIWKEGK